MKKLFTMLALFMASQVAQAEGVNALVITRLSASEATDNVKFVFADEPKFTYNGDNVEFSLGSSVKVEIPVTEKFQVTYADASKTAVESVDVDATVVVLNGKIEISAAANQSVAVYNVQGAQVVAAVTGADGRATISTDGFGKGIYVVRTEGVSFKFIK